MNASNIFIAKTLEVGVMTTIESLEEFTTFWFWLSARTAVGEGPYTVYGPVTTAIGEYHNYRSNVTLCIYFYKQV